jgi:hypothetical protein
MIHFMYSYSEMTGSMFDVAVLSRLVLRYARCCVVYTTTGRGTLVPTLDENNGQCTSK